VTPLQEKLGELAIEIGRYGISAAILVFVILASSTAFTPGIDVPMRTIGYLNSLGDRHHGCRRFHTRGTLGKTWRAFFIFLLVARFVSMMNDSQIISDFSDDNTESADFPLRH
jgi:hypothetical protein